MDPWNDIVDALADAAREMWDGAEPRPCDGIAIAGESVVAMIGYAGDTLKGALLLQASRKVTLGLQPPDVQMPSPTDTLLRDLLGELANQLLGRCKNKLAARGVLVVVATPVTAVGLDLRTHDLGPSSSVCLAVELPHGVVHVRFDAVISPELAMTAPLMDAAVTEGELLIF